MPDLTNMQKYRYDSNPYVCGLGKDNLLAIGDI